MAFELTQTTLWLINREFTRRGVAPQWRGVPRIVKAAPMPPANPQSVTPRRLGDVAQKNLMKRWIDLEWLRAALGVSHLTKKKSWPYTMRRPLDPALRTLQLADVDATKGATASTLGSN